MFILCHVIVEFAIQKVHTGSKSDAPHNQIEQNEYNYSYGEVFCKDTDWLFSICGRSLQGQR